jgi:hypothetical protein
MSVRLSEWLSLSEHLSVCLILFLSECLPIPLPLWMFISAWQSSFFISVCPSLLVGMPSLSVYLCFWLYVCLPVKRAIHLYICLCLSDYQSVCPSVLVTLCLTICLSVCLTVYLNLCLSYRLSVSIPVCRSDCPRVCPSIWMAIPLCTSVCLPVCLNICLTACLTDWQSVCISACLSVCLKTYVGKASSTLVHNSEQHMLYMQMVYVVE